MANLRNPDNSLTIQNDTPIPNDNSVVAFNRVSVDSSGNEANGESTSPVISGNGNFVAFSSLADNLVAIDTNEAQDVFVHDRQTGITNLVSVNSAGEQGNNSSGNASISADGRFVAFSSVADNLVATDTNEVRDVFIHDRQTGITNLVSVDLLGESGNGISAKPTISADGRFVVFESQADNLVPVDTNEARDIFIHEVATGITTPVSVNSAGEQANGNSRNYSMSADGRFIAFQSDADNLVPGENNCEIYISDRETGTITCITAESNPGDYIGDLSISNDGRFIVFESFTIPIVVDSAAEDTRSRIATVLHDRQTGESKSIPGLSTIAETSTKTSSISADGRFIAFTKEIPDGLGGVYIHDRFSQITITTAIFEELENELTKSFSAPPTAIETITQSPSFSADGSVIVFNSFIDDLVPGDTNEVSDIFVVSNLLAPQNRPQVDPSQPLMGTAESDRLLDIDNQDYIIALAGNDTIDSGRGNDEIFGNSGSDSIEGNNDNDTIYGGKDDDSLYGNNGDDLLLGQQGDDRLVGNDGNDIIFGGKGDDTIYGSFLGDNGNDILFGGKGNDNLYGSLGSDRLNGDLGDDLLDGGEGEDVFVLAAGGGNDTISSFEDGIDRLELVGGLTFSQLAIAPGEDNTISIIVANTGEIIGTITRADDITISVDDFITGFG